MKSFNYFVVEKHYICRKKMSNFANKKIKEVSIFLHKYKRKNKLTSLSASECVNIFDQNNILSSNFGPKPDFNYRDMLRDGRNKTISLVNGTHQKQPNTKWTIFRI